jgi:hypothetical protein
LADDPGGRQLNRNPVANDLYNLFLDNLRETKLKYQGNTKLVTNPKYVGSIGGKDIFNADFTTRDIASEVKGLPTSVVLQKKEDGLYYSPIVGFLPPDGFLKKGEESLQNSKKV